MYVLVSSVTSELIFGTTMNIVINKQSDSISTILLVHFTGVDNRNVNRAYAC